MQTIKAGTGIIAACQSGNRDAEVFPNPDQFDMHRKFQPVDSLGFGYGRHRCIAEWLAKAELEIVFGKYALHSARKKSTLADQRVKRHYSKSCRISGLRSRSQRSSTLSRRRTLGSLSCLLCFETEWRRGPRR